MQLASDVVLDGDDRRNQVRYVTKPSFKDVVENQQANGVFSSKVLELTNTKTITELVILNKNLHQLISNMNLSE